VTWVERELVCFKESSPSLLGGGSWRTDNPLSLGKRRFLKFRGHRMRYFAARVLQRLLFSLITDSLSAKLEKRHFSAD
jgi:hypothetical protein